MTSSDPAEITTLAEVRAGVDALDQRLWELLGQRFALMRAAARIKEERGQVRDEVRKADVVRSARSAAARAGVPDWAAERLWGELVELSIAYELEEWDRLTR